MGGSGGGSSGKVDWPSEYKDRYYRYLDEMEDIVDDLVAGINPYSLAASYDPTTEFATADTRITAVGTAADAYTPSSDGDENTDYASYTATAETEVDDHMETGTADIDAAVTAFETKTAPALGRSLNRVSQPMGFGNATTGSAFPIAFVLQQAQYDGDVAKYRGDLTLTAATQRRVAIMESIRVMVSLNELTLNESNAKHGMLAQAAQESVEFARIKFVAKSEQMDKDVEYDVEDAMWDLRVYEPLGNLLAAGSGASTVSKPGKTGGFASVLGGAMSGAAMGASMTPINPLIGGAIGGAIGIGASLF